MVISIGIRYNDFIVLNLHCRYCAYLLMIRGELGEHVSYIPLPTEFNTYLKKNVLASRPTRILYLKAS